MEAHLIRFALGFSAIASMGATVQSPNFTVTAPTEEIAQRVARHAEHYRRELAVQWLGHELDNWYAPCPVSVKVGQMGAGGATSFSFHRGETDQMEVSGWKMDVQGSLERILDSVIPHEVSHTIFACHFRRALPRWADEGAATLAENDSEKRRQIMLAQDILKGGSYIPFRQLMEMMEYPNESQGVLNLYAQGYTLASLLVQNGGQKKYLRFLAEANEIGWDRALSKHYQYNGIDGLERGWKQWVDAGCPSQSQSEQEVLLVKNTRSKSSQRADVVVRGQNSDDSTATTGIKTRPKSAKKRRLVAPKPKIAGRRQRPTAENVTLTVAAPTKKKTAPRSKNRRYSNEGWVAVTTSGRARPAATQKTMPEAARVAKTRKKNTKPKARIPANRRPTRWSEFPSRPSRSLSRDDR